jgi:hypothetical protein
LRPALLQPVLQVQTTKSKNISKGELSTLMHEMLDQIRLAQHELIAKKLQQNPEPILALAQRNLQRDVGHRLAPPTYLWRQWRVILEQNSIDCIVAIITAKTRKAIELRQASPFSGVLSPEEIARTIQREKERARALMTP